MGPLEGARPAVVRASWLPLCEVLGSAGLFLSPGAASAAAPTQLPSCIPLLPPGRAADSLLLHNCSHSLPTPGTGTATAATSSTSVWTRLCPT